MERKKTFIEWKLRIIGRGWAKYRDFSVLASRSIICRSWKLKQIIDLRDTDRSRHFAITEFNNCFIIRSPGFFFHILITSWQLKEAIFHFCLENVVPITQEQNIIWSRTGSDGITQEQIIISRQLFAGHAVGTRSMGRKKKMPRMIIWLIC